MLSFDKSEESFFIKSLPSVFSENGCGNKDINKIPYNAYKDCINKIGGNKSEGILKFFLLYGEHYGRNHKKQSDCEGNISRP